MASGVVIVGSGLAGYGVAREFRKWDASTPLTILTADDGAYYSKPQLSAAMGAGKTADQLVMKDAASMARELGARLMAHQNIVLADAAAKRLVTEQGLEIGFDKLVLAVGARARRPAVSLGDGARIHSVNNLGQYREFRRHLEKGRRLAILGAGLIGCEFAHDFSQAGFQVTVIGTGAVPLAGLVPEGIGRALQAALSGLGVRWKLSQGLEAVAKSGEGWLARLRGGDSVEADVLLSAIGFDPNLELARLLELKTARGIAVDAELRSSHPDIFALGDCAEIGGRWLPFVMPLNHAAKALGQILAGMPAAVEFPLMPVLIKTPAYPVAVLTPPAGAKGEWLSHAEPDGARAAFRDERGALMGFAVGGKLYPERNALLRQMAAEANGSAPLRAA
ncbi:MAG TPA: FAD-dependent oxidoreductase [Fibrobacteria bacterium]|nr:FAD-dependent oxidoreductase [Fibrobacteria bacterium]